MIKLLIYEKLFFKDFGPTKNLAKFYLDCNNKSLNCTYWRQIL